MYARPQFGYCSQERTLPSVALFFCADLCVNSNLMCRCAIKTSLWDTCATEALILAAGGLVSNLFGWPIEHVSVKYRHNRYRNRASDPAAAIAAADVDGVYGNRLGVFVTG